MGLKTNKGTDSLFDALAVVDSVPTDSDFDDPVDGLAVLYDDGSGSSTLYFRVDGEWRAVGVGNSGTRLVKATITFEDSTVTLGSLASGEVVTEAWAEVLTTFDAATTNVVTLGDGTDDDKYLAAADVDETTAGASSRVGPFAAETSAGTLTATYAQTGTAATQGEAVVYAVVASA